MKEGEFWRAQIVWPNGAVNFFGKFASELEAQRWINGHSWLTAHVVEDSKFAAKDPAGEQLPWGSAPALPAALVDTTES